MALRKVTPIKKIALVVETTRGMLSIKHFPDSPTETCGECYHKYFGTDSPITGSAISHLTEVHGSLSLVSHR